MSSASTISLTEVITALAFNDPVPASQIANLIAVGRWGSNRQDVLDRISNAVEDICDAGFSGNIKCWGRITSGEIDITNNIDNRFSNLRAEDFLEYRKYICGYDDLWKGTSEIDEYSNSFSGHASSEYIRDIQIERKEAAALRKSYRGTPKFTDVERANWIKNYQGQNGDKAYRDFRQEPKYDGTKQADFRKEWREIRQQPRGRPREKA